MDNRDAEESAGTQSHAEQPAWVHNLLDERCFDHAVTALELIETHISWVILTGPFAYKIKKPVDLGFLDFSTLDKRRHYAEEELRLNRRLSPSLYLVVVPVTGTEAAPSLRAGSPEIDYAVKMVQFPQAAQLDRMLERGELQPAHLDAFAGVVARFHAEASVAGPEVRYGTPAAVYEPVDENFRQIREHQVLGVDLEQVDELQRWSRHSWEALQELFEKRKADGFVREGHGDLHLRNLAWVDDEPLVFDCIEFNPALRWIDVLSDVAFLMMDLQDRQRIDLAWRFINRYLEVTGDYEHLAVLPYYLMYRALVRAKVTAIRLDQENLEQAESAAVNQEFRGYLDLATRYTRVRTGALVLTCGLSGSGKTTVTGELLETLGAIRLRSDIERKRLFGMDPLQSGKADVGEGIYSEEAGRRTYDRLQTLASALLEAGATVIVDAANLQAAERDRFRALAGSLGVGFTILEITAPEAVLRQRLEDRRGDVSDADVAVLEAQLAHWPAIGNSEREWVIPVDTSRPVEMRSLARQIRRSPAPQS